MRRLSVVKCWGVVAVQVWRGCWFGKAGGRGECGRARCSEPTASPGAVNRPRSHHHSITAAPARRPGCCCLRRRVPPFCDSSSRPRRRPCLGQGSLASRRPLAHDRPGARLRPLRRLHISPDASPSLSKGASLRLTALRLPTARQRKQRGAGRGRAAPRAAAA